MELYYKMKTVPGIFCLPNRRSMDLIDGPFQQSLLSDRKFLIFNFIDLYIHCSTYLSFTVRISISSNRKTCYLNGGVCIYEQNLFSPFLAILEYGWLVRRSSAVDSGGADLYDWPMIKSHYFQNIRPCFIFGSEF